MMGMIPSHWNNDVINPTFLCNGRPHQFHGYREDILFTEAMNWIKNRPAAGPPFFVYLATFSPHGPHYIPEKYAAPYRTGRGKGAADFFGMIANIDENVGRLEEFLAANRLRDDTILIFMTDNGGTGGIRICNAGMRGSKGSPYEGGHRVPFFIRWPAGELTGGRDVDGLTAHLDVFPTLADLIGLGDRTPKDIEGVSLASLLRGQSQSVPERALVVRLDQGSKKDRDRSFS
jgi:arylsulfatase A-like enzyme